MKFQKMEKALEAYGEYMRYTASQYKKAQNSAISRGSQFGPVSRFSTK
ncbi:MAG: hypothetical protein J6K43_04825 [Lachnospiraceae bacterium]|nr:hypothetical protein [Lachnospiraceae bacterium]